MCGIAGWYRGGGRPVSEGVIAEQCARLRHRGPDDQGVFVSRDFGFGMRRLSIVDLPGGHQPMTTPDGRHVIVFNGEIFNHADLRLEIGRRSAYFFRTRSDTETVLAAFQTWGDDAWTMLEGMFAIAVWDERERKLTLARDPLGIKPLYVSRQQGGISFASEMDALRAVPGNAFSVNDRAVHDFFSFGHVRRPRSIYHEVEQIEPGRCVTIGPTGVRTTSRFWTPRTRPAPVFSETDWIEQTRAMLLETVRRHQQSDVPVGAFLSGGIDSSGVLAAMRRTSTRPITAFTVGYPGSQIDETATARKIAEHLGCEHVVVPLEESDAVSMVEDVQRGFDEPFAEMGALPLWALSAKAASSVKVVLCGEGSDEIFAGYKRHRNARLIERFRPMLEALGPMLRSTRHIPSTRSARLNALRQHIERLSDFVALPDGAPQFFAATQISRHRDRLRLYAPAFLREHDDDASLTLIDEYGLGDQPEASALEQFLIADLSVGMPSSMLPRLDRASMAHSLEARVPFLSHKFVDWALTMPQSMKLRGRVGKYALRKAIAPWLPPEIATLPKQPLQIPLAAWMRGGLGSYARECFYDGGAADSGYLDAHAVERFFSEHLRGEFNHGRLLYAVLTFSLWWRDEATRRRSTVAAQK